MVSRVTMPCKKTNIIHKYIRIYNFPNHSTLKKPNKIVIILTILPRSMCVHLMVGQLGEQCLRGLAGLDLPSCSLPHHQGFAGVFTAVPAGSAFPFSTWFKDLQEVIVES